MAEPPVLVVRNLIKQFGGRRGQPLKTAVRDVNLELEPGRFLAVVGASGSGKSTLARCIAGLETPTSGSIQRTVRVQLIFQQPAASLNPRFTAGEVVCEPLWIQGCRDRRVLAKRTADAITLVGLPESVLERRAHELSGGERQRLAIARALANEPGLLILDESFAGLDLSVQARVGVLLMELQRQRGLSCILISHDLGLVGRLADKIAVMENGAIVEHGPAPELLAAPRHSSTRTLCAAAAALSLNGEFP